MKRGKAVVSLILCIVILTSLVSFTMFSENESTAYNMYVNNIDVGIVKYAAKGLALYDSAMNQISKQYPKDVSIQSEVHFKESIGGSALTSESQIADAIGK
ncbi:MAG: hypothetical protein GX783_01925, partial [Clostridiales bacterium]|nr:hypothetical protein [Clostridiales bacterium]